MIYLVIVVLVGFFKYTWGYERRDLGVDELFWRLIREVVGMGNVIGREEVKLEVKRLSLDFVGDFYGVIGRILELFF